MTSFDAVILAGGMRSSPLARALGTNVLALPLSAQGSLLGAWLHCLHGTQGCRAVTILVSRTADVGMIRSELAILDRDGLEKPPCDVQIDRNRWRGTAGCVRDVLVDAAATELVVVVEGPCVPPPTTLNELLEPLRAQTWATVGVAANGCPAGAYAFTAGALELVPRLGFFDLKEQLLPALHQDGHAALAVRIVRRARRLWDRTGYLAAVAEVRDRSRQDAGAREYEHEGVGPAVTRDSLVGCQAVVDPTALVDESIVLNGARVGAGAIVTRSIIGPGASVLPAAVIRDAVVSPGLSSPRAAPGRRRRHAVPRVA